MKHLWKRSISLLLVLCTLVGYIVLPDVPAAKAETETEATNPNLVENGTFETHLADDTVKANTTGWGNMSGFWSVVAEEGKENNYVAKVADTSASSGRYIYYGFSVEPGETYTFKIDYKGAYTSGAPDLYVRQNAYNGTNLHKKGALALSADTWQTYEATVDIPASATTVYILVASGTAAKGTAYFDNVSFTKVVNSGGEEGGNEGGEGGDEGGDETPVLGNLIGNATFGDTAAKTDGWTNLANSPIWSVVADPDKADNYILQLADDKTNVGGYVYYKLQPQVGYYKLKFDYKTDDAPQVLVRANSTSSSGVELANVVLPSTEGQWKTYETILDLPAKYSVVNVMFNSIASAKNTAWFDNIVFERTELGSGGGEVVEPEYEIVIPEQNLLKNPMFELTLYSYSTPLDAATAPNGWTLETNGTGVQLFKSNVISAYDKEWSIHAVDISPNGSFKLSAKVENIQPGVEYMYTYYRTGEGAPRYGVCFYDADGKLLQEVYNNQKGYSDWRYSWRTVVAPEGASYAIVYLESRASERCNIYLDNLTFYVSSDATKTNLLPNFSFEEYPEGFQDKLVSKTTEVTTKGWRLSNSENITLVPAETELDKKYVGNYMLKFTDPSDTVGFNAYYTLDIEPGKTYAFSTMIRGDYASSNATIRISYYQDEACNIPAQINGKDYKSTAIGCGPEYWTRASLSATAPENAIKMRVYVASNVASVGWCYLGNLSVVEDVTNKFANLDFEDTDKSGAMAKWNSYENGKLSANKKTVFAGKLALQIKDNSQAVQQGAVSKLTDLSGYQIAGYASDNLFYNLSARVKDTKNVKAQLAIVYYDNGFKELKTDVVTSAGTGKWQLLELSSKAPENAAYAKILLLVGDKPATTGTVYVDDMTIFAEYGQYIDKPYNWKIKHSEGNRLFFTDEELEVIKKFAKDDTINVFGVSGANAYRALIGQANTYLTQNYFYYNWDASPDNDKVTQYKINLDHIQDISADPLLADVPGGRNWPYLEGITNGLILRFQTVAMAYALTGEAKYAEKAIGWALDMCEWEYWCETKYSWAMDGGVNSTLDTPRIVIGLATIYDMCYDQMTQAERDLIRENIIHKGLQPLYLDLTGPKRLQFHNKYMMRCSGLLTGTLAIINEDNKAELGKYLDRAYAFATAFLDGRYSEADNEGYLYTSLSLEDLVMAMDCAARVTGRESLLKHPYFSEVFIDWATDFLSPSSNEYPVYSDTYASGYFKNTMLMLNKTTGNGKAGYFLLKTGLDAKPLTVLLYANYEPVVTEPTENDYVVFSERVGYGGMRTGWEDGDLMFYIIGNNNASGHSNYDQLSFQITTEGLWPASDPGYSNLSEGFDEQEGHNTIIVDGLGQSVKGHGTLSSVVDSQLYGQFSGSAPDAYMAADAEGNYTIPLLTQFDRHAIMMNHGDRPYYIVIDELASDSEHVYDFNLNTGGWTDIAVDGKPLGDKVVKGNKVAIYGNNGYIFAEFVSKNKLNIEGKMYEDGGPVLQADNGAQKSQQFMTILTKPYGVETDETYSFLKLLNTPDLVAYKTSSTDGVITKSANAQGTPVYFFRGHKAGDWIELPFTASETGTYDLVLKIGKSYNYGIYKIYIDGEYITTYDGYDPSVFVYNLDLGKREITAGEHILKLELIGTNSAIDGMLISVAAITFGTDRGLPESTIYTQEVYDTDKVLGAKIFHTVNNSDIVLHNRTTGKISAGGVTTTGEQAAIIGLMEDGYMEGFTVVAGTSLVFNGKTLMKSTNKATVSADFRGKAKYTVTAEKDQSVSLYSPYEIVGATVDGKSVKYSVSGDVAKVSVPAGTHTVVLQVKSAVEYLWGNEGGEGKTIYDENGEIIYKIWKGIDGTEYLYEDGQLRIDAYFDEVTKLLVREELLEDDSWQITYYDILGNVNKIEIQHTNGNLTIIQHQTDGSISTTVTDKRGEYLEMTMDYPDGSKTVAQYLDDKTVTTKYGTNGNVLAVTTMYNDGRRVEETYDENGKLLSKITRMKGGDREEVVYNVDGSVVTSTYVANKLASVKTVNADGTAVLEEYLEDGSVRVTKYDKDGNVTEVTVDGKPVEEEKDDNWLWIGIAIGAVAVVGAAVLVIVLVKIKKRNAQQDAEESASEE